MVKNIIRQYVRKRTTKKDKEGIMITLPDPQQVDFKVSLITEILMRNGVDPNTIKTDEMLENVMAAIERKESMEQGIVASQQADVFNTAGQKLDPNQPIIGGTQPGKAIDQDAFRRLAERNPELIKQRIANRRVETDAEIQARLEKGNEEGLARIRNQQKMLEEAIDDASPGFANDIKVDAELVAENLAERMGLVYDDLPTKQRLDIYDQAYTGLSKERFKQRETKRLMDDMKEIEDPEDMADGGRIGFKDGMDRRTFMKIMAGIASIPVVGKLFKGAKGAKVAKEVVKTPAVKGKPKWFDSLVNKVIAEGEDVSKSFATKERELVNVKRLDEETTVYVHRDLDTGTVRVDIDDPVRNVQGDQGDALVSLEFKPGQADETTKGKPADEFTAVENDYANYMDGPDDYVTEVTDNTVTDTKDLTSDLTKVKLYAKDQKKPTIKEMMIEKDRKKVLKQAEENPSQYAADRYTGPEPDSDYIDDINDMASGGIAGYSGGGIVKAIIKNLAKQKGIRPSDYLKAANYKALPPEVKRLMGEEEFNRIKQQLMEGRTQMVENMRDMVRSRLDFNERKKEFRDAMAKVGGKGMADDIIEKSLSDKQFGSVVPESVTEQDFLEIEQMIKNMQTKDGRKMNASGGIASMLGE
jgi:hypothetical protein